MKEIKQSRYKLILATVCCVILSFAVCLLVFNAFSGNLAVISVEDGLCSMFASFGIDIIFVLIFYEIFLKSTLKIYDDKIVYLGKTMLFKDILDINIDSTFHKQVKRVYINSAKEQFVLTLNSVGFTQLFEYLPTIKTDTGEEEDKIALDTKSSDTLIVRLINTMFYLTLCLAILLIVVLTFRQKGGKVLVANFNQEYIWYSACVIWGGVLLAQILHFVVIKIKYNHYTVKFYEDNMVIVFGNKIINNREIKRENVNAVKVRQSLVGRIAGKYRVKLVTDSIGGGTNEFDYFPYLLNEEQKDMIVKYLLGEKALEIKTQRAKLFCNTKSVCLGLLATALIIIMSVFYSLAFLFTLLLVWFVVSCLTLNKRYSDVGGEIGVVSYGLSKNTLYFKTDRVESVECQRDLISRMSKSSMITLYLYGYKEQLFLGDFDKAFAESLISKLKK